MGGEQWERTPQRLQEAEGWPARTASGGTLGLGRKHWPGWETQGCSVSPRWGRRQALWGAETKRGKRWGLVAPRVRGLRSSDPEPGGSLALGTRRAPLSVVLQRVYSWRPGPRLESIRGEGRPALCALGPLEEEGGVLETLRPVARCCIRVFFQSTPPCTCFSSLAVRVCQSDLISWIKNPLKRFSYPRIHVLSLGARFHWPGPAEEPEPRRDSSCLGH